MTALAEEAPPPRVAGASPSAALVLAIHNRLDELARANAWLAAFADAADLADDVRYRLDLGLTEAVSNTIAYGFPEGGEHLIELRLNQDGGAATLEVIDNGLAFDPLQVAAPAKAASLAAAPTGGLGILLIRTMLDECHYERDADRNHLSMTARPRATCDV